MREWLIAVCMVGGAFFMLLSALGLVRMPDFYLRAQVTTKAFTLGLAGLMAAAAIHFATASVITRSLLVIAFVFLTGPVAMQMLGRSAYFRETPRWRCADCDELRGHYDLETHALSGGDAAPRPPAPGGGHARPAPSAGAREEGPTQDA